MEAELVLTAFEYEIFLNDYDKEYYLLNKKD